MLHVGRFEGAQPANVQQLQTSRLASALWWALAARLGVAPGLALVGQNGLSWHAGVAPRLALAVRWVWVPRRAWACWPALGRSSAWAPVWVLALWSAWAPVWVLAPWSAWAPRQAAACWSAWVLRWAAASWSAWVHRLGAQCWPAGASWLAEI